MVLFESATFSLNPLDLFRIYMIFNVSILLNDRSGLSTLNDYKLLS